MTRMAFRVELAMSIVSFIATGILWFEQNPYGVITGFFACVALLAALDEL